MNTVITNTAEAYREKGKIVSEDDTFPRESYRFRTAKRLVQAKSTAGYRSHHFWIIMVLAAGFAGIYYTVANAYYSVSLVIFIFPLVYSATVFRLRGVTICSVFILILLLPSTFLNEFTSLALSRVLIFIIVAYIFSGMWANMLNYFEERITACEKIASLDAELNDYIERLENTQKQLIQAEKLNAIGQLSASIAHEINTPLSSILLHSAMLLKKIQGDTPAHKEAEESLANIENAVNHCSHIVKSLLDFSRPSKSVFIKVTIAEILKEVMTLTIREANVNNIETSVGNMDSIPEITADAVQIRQVFVNLGNI